MRKKILYGVVGALLPPLLLLACVSMKSGLDLPAKHPFALEKGKRPVCTECHEARDKHLDYQRFVHTAYFMNNHRQEAYQYRQVCAMCHDTSFCNDCHATRVELKPSIKNETENYRQLPHRGDYLSRHMIDGRIDPTSCFRCHGNPQASRICNSCHR